MRRRRVLAYGAVVAGLTSYTWSVTDSEDETESPLLTPTGTANRTAENDRMRSSVTPHIGGSLNGRARRIRGDVDLIEKSDTTWLHTFLDVRKKLEAGRDPRTDPDVEALRRLSRETDVKLIVALKWNFTGNFGNVEPTNVPRSGSSRRETLFEYATELLEAVDRPADVIVLGNEPVWEAPDEDVVGSDSTLLSFTRELKDHLLEHYTAGSPRLLVGAFNKLYGDYVRDKYGDFYEGLFEMARNDDDIDGVDLHVHYDRFQQAREMFSVARNEVPEGTITATEFSPVWRYERNAETPIGSFDGGGRFAERYGHSPETTVADYYRAAQENPRPPDEMADFMEAMPWYNVDFVADTYDLLDEYDAEVGAFGILQTRGFRHTELTDEWIPFQINYLFQRGVIDSEDGAHPHYLRDYRERA